MNAKVSAHSTSGAAQGGIAPEVLTQLKNIVGDSHASADRAVLSTYYWNAGVGALPGPKQGEHWPVAVVLPDNTEEVAAVVRLCVAHGLRYRALSTGNGATIVTLLPNVVMIDLVRMNRIVKIDRANQMAVIEPYVTAGKLQAEAMKLGLTCHIVGAGPAHSPLASATSFAGIGITGSSTGHNARNILSLEWVSPEGDIVRMGTCGDDWFSEEGPGPGFRGIVRGMLGANGSLGVFTRIGYKLFPWSGPARPEISGRQPQLGQRLGGNMRFLLPIWPSPEQMTEATFRLNRSGVAFAMLRMPPGHIAWTLTRDNSEYVTRQAASDLPDITDIDNRFGWQVLTTGHSARHAALQERTVRHIVEQTGGRFLELPTEYAEVLVRNLVTSAYVGRVFRGAGCGGTSFGVYESFDLWPGVLKAGESIMAPELQAGGAFFSESKEGFWAWPTEGRTLWTENILAARANTAAGMGGALRGMLQHLDMVDRDPALGNMTFLGGPLFDLYGNRLQGLNTWMRRIKNMLDPTDSADHSMSVAPKLLPISRWWPLISRILFSRPGAPLLRAITNWLGSKST